MKALLRSLISTSGPKTVTDVMEGKSDTGASNDNLQTLPAGFREEDVEPYRKVLGERLAYLGTLFYDFPLRH